MSTEVTVVVLALIVVTTIILDALLCTIKKDDCRDMPLTIGLMICCAVIGFLLNEILA